MRLIDTHCHIHEAVSRTTPVFDKWNANGQIDVERMLDDARMQSVSKLICVGTTLADSKLAVEFAGSHENTWSSIGIHPHEAKDHLEKASQDTFTGLAAGLGVKAVGECGLDYFYSHSPKQDQVAILKFQIELAQMHNLPMIFHVRDASPAEQRNSVWNDFWPIFEQYHSIKPIRGVLHSFTDTKEHMDKAIGLGLYIGVNGIATFTKSESQLAMYAAIPSDHLLLETDAPFLTPAPYRGMMCEPKHVRTTAEFLANLRNLSLVDLAAHTTANAQQLFGI